MAFHVACPLTCRKICYCALGGPGLLQKFDGRLLANGVVLEKLLATSAFVLSTGQENVEVLVPRLTKDHKKKKKRLQSGPFDGSNLKRVSSDQTKPQIAGMLLSESVETEAHVKSEELVESNTSNKHLLEAAKGDRNWSVNENVMINIPQSDVPLVKCNICSSNEISGSQKAKKMLPCKGCGRVYHRSCLKQWAQHRDVFNWASWICSSCRHCEVCKRAGDASLLRFCKRCDAAYHSYCQQLSVKHVPSGPYLCPKHTRCHSCGSHVPGSGVSSRWFLSFNFCDACGRLFVKGKYCPICLKVYRESEPSPMVCCDVCEHWVHCSCDGISEEKYQQFQKDDNLLFKCAACRGECHQVRDLEDAVHELWKRRDDSERDEVEQRRASLGLPGKEEMRNLSPSSDDDEAENDIEQDKKIEVYTGKNVFEKTDTGKNESDSLGGLDWRGAGKATLTKAENRVSKISDGHQNTESDNNYKLKLHFRGLEPEKASTYISNGSTSIPRDHWKESETEVPLSVDSKIHGKKPAEVHGSKQDSSAKSSGQMQRLKAEKNISESEKHASLGDVRISKEGKKKHIKTTNYASLAESQRGVQQTGEKTRSTKLILDLSAHEFKKSNKVMKESSIVKPMGDLKRPLLSSSTKELEEVQSSGKKEQQARDKSRDNMDDAYIGQESKPSKKAVAETIDSREVEKAIQIPKASGDYPPPAWGTHSESRRQRLPSSKFRDMDTSAWRRMSTHLHLGNEWSNSTGSVSASEGLPATTLLKGEVAKERKLSVNAVSSESSHDQPFTTDLSGSMFDDRFSRSAHKKIKVLAMDEGSKERAEKQKNTVVEGSLSKSLTLKIKKPPVIDEENQYDGMHESTGKGQRTKRKRPVIAEPVETPEDLIAQSCLVEKIDNGDDTSILQRLGLDAVAKRVEVFQSKKNNWRKGTIVAVFPHKLQFSIQYDNGDKKIQKYGKERVRLLSTSKRVN